MVQKSPSKREDFKRNKELENVLGNLLITEIQGEKLKTRLVNLYHDSYGRQKNSTYTFIHDNKLYKVHIEIESPDKSTEPEEREDTI